MKAFLQHLAIVLFHLGGVGQLILGVLDSSFLVMPLGNDLLMVALGARRPVLVPYYAAMATIGSVLGCLTVDLVFRKGGEKGLERRMSKKQFGYVKRKVEKRAGWALALASLMPPPFPFTPFVAGAAAFEYPRKRLLAIIGGTRFLRFMIDGGLAILFGASILSLAKSPAVQWSVVAVIVVSIGASGLSIYRWIRRGRRQPRVSAAADT